MDQECPRILNLTTTNFRGKLKGIHEPLDKMQVLGYLNFPGVPTDAEIEEKAYALARYCDRETYREALISGPNFLIEPLVRHLREHGIKPKFLQTIRQS